MQVNTAERVEEHYGVEINMLDAIVYTDDARAWVIAQMRRLADRLESGELRSCRSELNHYDDAEPVFTQVEAYADPVRVNGVLMDWHVQQSTVRFKPASEAPRALALVKE